MKALRTILFPLCWRDKDVYLEIFRENKERYKAMQKKRGYDFQLFEFVLEKLMKPEPLDIKNKDHDLRGGIQRIQRMSYLTGLVINLSL